MHEIQYKQIKVETTLDTTQSNYKDKQKLWEREETVTYLFLNLYGNINIKSVTDRPYNTVWQYYQNNNCSIRM